MTVIGLIVLVMLLVKNVFVTEDLLLESPRNSKAALGMISASVEASFSLCCFSGDFICLAFLLKVLLGFIL